MLAEKHGYSFTGILNKLHGAKPRIFFLAFTTFFLASIVFTDQIGVVNKTSNNDGNVLDSQIDDERELWFNPHWHNREFVKVNPQGYERRIGTPIEYQIDFTGFNVDPNSIRVVKNRIEIPCDYDPVTKTVIFVVDESIDVSSEKPYTIYFDEIENGIKSAPNYDPEWVAQYSDTSVKQTIDDKINNLKQQFDDWYENRRIVKDSSGVYHYRDSIVYFNETIDRWCYEENGTAIDNYVALIFTYKDSRVQLVDPLGELSIWMYINNTIIGEMDVLRDICFNASLYNASNGYLGCLNYSNSDRRFDLYNADGEIIATYTDTPIGENVWMGYQYGGVDLAGMAFGLEEDNYESWSVGNVKAKGQGSTKYHSPTYGDVVITQKATAYRGCPDVVFEGSTDVPDAEENAWGSAMFNLNGTILFNNTQLDYFNFTDYLEAQGANLTEWGDLVSQTVQDARDETSGYALLTEEGNLIPTTFNWSDTSCTYDLTSIYDTGNPTSAEILVKPFLLQSKYFGIYDLKHGVGMGLVFPDDQSLCNILVEFWKETLSNGDINYYLNVSMNYLDWWKDSIADAENLIIIAGNSGNIHLPQNLAFTSILTYILSWEPTTWLQDIIAEYVHIAPRPKTKAFTNGKDKSLPINIKINKPTENQRFKHKKDIEIDVDILGETVANIYYKWGNGIKVTFSGKVQYWEDVETVGHYATNGIADSNEFIDILASLTGEVNLSIYAYDTNGTAVLAQVPIVLEEPVEQIFFMTGLILAGALAGGLAVFFVMRQSKNAKSSTHRKVTDGAACRTDGRRPGSSGKPVPSKKMPVSSRKSDGARKDPSCPTPKRRY